MTSLGSLIKLNARISNGGQLSMSDQELEKTALLIPKLLSLRPPKALVNSLGQRDAYKAWAGMRRGTDGPDSILMLPISMVAGKILSKKNRNAIRNAGWKHLGSHATRADISVGSVLSKIPLIGKPLFTIKEKLPTGNNGIFKEYLRPSALAPLAKARNIAEPVVMGYAIDKGINKLREGRSENSTMDQQTRVKVASTMLRLNDENKEHTKRAHALKLLYKKAEMGVEPLPHSYRELEEKLASLLNQDLEVLEKALELTGGSMKLGELAVADQPYSLSASEQFQAEIFGDDY